MSSADRVTREEVIFAINRNALNGAMQARLSDPNTMQVTVSVRVDDTMVPGDRRQSAANRCPHGRLQHP